MLINVKGINCILPNVIGSFIVLPTILFHRKTTEIRRKKVIILIIQYHHHHIIIMIMENQALKYQFFPPKMFFIS